MNRWTDPSFENGTPGLTLEGQAQILDAPGYWPDGSKGLYLLGSEGELGQPGQSSYARRTLVTVPGMPHAISARVALVLQNSGLAPLQVVARTVGGTVIATFSYSVADPTFQLWQAGTFVALEAATVVEWRCEEAVGKGSSWGVDLVDVSDAEVDVAYKILEIQDALKTRAEALSIANGDSVDMASGEVRLGHVGEKGVQKWPSIQLDVVGWTEGETAELAVVDCDAMYAVHIYFRGETAREDAVKLALDFSKAIRFPANPKQYLDLGYVDGIQSSDFDRANPDPTSTEFVWLIGTITVRFRRLEEET